MINSVRIKAVLITTVMCVLVSCKGNDDTMGNESNTEIGVTYSDSTNADPATNNMQTSPGTNGGTLDNNSNDINGTETRESGTRTDTMNNGSRTNRNNTNDIGTTPRSGTNNNGGSLDGEGSRGTTNPNPRQ